MKKICLLLFSICCLKAIAHAQADDFTTEPWTYKENFETRQLGAWASYPMWQDNAYDQNFRVNELVPGDPNISLVQRVTPYSHVDNYAGAEKLLNMYLKPGAAVSFRYYLKTTDKAEFFKIRFAAGEYGAIDVTLPSPETNKWVSVNVGFDDFVRENPSLAGKSQIHIYALAFLTKVPAADPNMPIYLGLDDISFKAWRAAEFQFAQPAVARLPEFDPYIAVKPYAHNDLLNLSGRWTLSADKVKFEIVPYSDQDKIVYEGSLSKKEDLWSLTQLKLDFPDGLYLGRLKAYAGSKQLSSTQFTLHIFSKKIADVHPRLLFDAKKEDSIARQLQEDKFKPVLADILKSAKAQRERFPLSSLVYDLDQFPDEDWLPTWSAFGSRIYGTGEALKNNALAYAFTGDTVAGNYAKNAMNSFSTWPSWVSPWVIKRGKFNEHRMGTWSHSVALAYDLTYNLMSPQEKEAIRNSITKFIIGGAHSTYVYNDDVISNTSNWIGHTVGGSLMNIAAIYGDGPQTDSMEIYFAGAMMKFESFLNHVTDKQDGAWGEGYGYNSYTFSNLSRSIPSLYNVFNVDVTAPLVKSYNEFIWGGHIKERKWFAFGDSGDSIMNATNWAFLLSMRHEPRLSWFYHFLKSKETLDDLIFNTEGVKEDGPFDENPDKIFHQIGTTVFKSGWDNDDLTFVMRTGAFYNHQHIDQGSFWYADHGINFIEDQPIHNSSYYDDPLYQPSFIQPVSHSTILINGNEQSQRVGDPYRFAPGFNDHAFIDQALDGSKAAFSRGDIGRLYWGKVESLTRNVLYLKPATILMLDVAVPAKADAEVTLLYHTAHLNDINANQSVSKITKDGYSLNLMHLSPANVEAKAVETPHYLNTLNKKKGLAKEGMLTVSAHTNGAPLVMANLLATTATGETPDVKSAVGNGFVSGTASGQLFAFSTKLGSVYKPQDIETDALAVTWGNDWYFAAMAKTLRKNGTVLFESDVPVTCEISSAGIKYDRDKSGQITVGVSSRPKSVRLNGAVVKNINYNSKSNTIVLQVPAGEGNIVIR